MQCFSETLIGKGDSERPNLHIYNSRGYGGSLFTKIHNTNIIQHVKLYQTITLKNEQVKRFIANKTGYRGSNNSNNINRRANLSS